VPAGIRARRPSAFVALGRRSASFLATAGLVTELEDDAVEIASAAAGVVFETLVRARLAVEE
jgi:hypothetical protein